MELCDEDDEKVIDFLSPDMFFVRVKESIAGVWRTVEVYGANGDDSSIHIAPLRDNIPTN